MNFSKTIPHWLKPCFSHFSMLQTKNVTYLFCWHGLHLFFCVLSFIGQLRSVLSFKNLFSVFIKLQLDNFHFAWVNANTNSCSISLLSLDPLNVNYLWVNKHNIGCNDKLLPFFYCHKYPKSPFTKIPSLVVQNTEKQGSYFTIGLNM